jgi:copper chaperone NosL
MLNRCLLYAISLVIITTTLSSASQQPAAPGPDDLCPVCNMFVERYPDWVATVSYKDGTTHYFDGAKHLFKYLFDMEKWAPGRPKDTIKNMTVKSYSDPGQIDARSAFYVFGSDVLGPMGHELVPFSSEEEAQKFLQLHKGKGIKRFGDLDGKFIMKLHKGIFDAQ